MVIRPARRDDAEAVRRVVHEAYGHYVARLGTLPGPMLENGAALGGVLVLEDAGDALLLDNVAVAPGAQGRGYGAMLTLTSDQLSD